MEGPIEFQPTKANVNYFETTHPLEVLQDVTLIQKRPQLSEGKFNFIWYTYLYVLHGTLLYFQLILHIPVNTNCWMKLVTKSIF